MSTRCWVMQNAPFNMRQGHMKQKSQNKPNLRQPHESVLPEQVERGDVLFVRLEGRLLSPWARAPSSPQTPSLEPSALYSYLFLVLEYHIVRANGLRQLRPTVVDQTRSQVLDVPAISSLSVSCPPLPESPSCRSQVLLFRCAKHAMFKSTLCLVALCYSAKTSCRSRESKREMSSVQKL